MKETNTNIVTEKIKDLEKIFEKISEEHKLEGTTISTDYYNHEAYLHYEIRSDFCAGPYRKKVMGFTMYVCLSSLKNPEVNFYTRFESGLINMEVLEILKQCCSDCCNAYNKIMEK